MREMFPHMATAKDIPAIIVLFGLLTWPAWVLLLVWIFKGNANGS